MPTKAELTRKRPKSDDDEDFPLTLRRGSTIVKLYRHREKSYQVYTLVYYLHGDRKRPTFASQ